MPAAITTALVLSTRSREMASSSTVDIALQCGIDRDEVVNPVELHAMAGIIDGRDIGIVDAIGKIAQRAAHICRAQIKPRVDDVECHHAKECTDRAGITWRIWAI